MILCKSLTSIKRRQCKPLAHNPLSSQLRGVQVQRDVKAGLGLKEKKWSFSERPHYIDTEFTKLNTSNPRLSQSKKIPVSLGHIIYDCYFQHGVTVSWQASQREHSKSPKTFPRYGLCNQIGTRLSASKSSRVRGGDGHGSVLGLHRSSGEHLYWTLLTAAVPADSGFNP